MYVLHQHTLISLSPSPLPLSPLPSLPPLPPPHPYSLSLLSSPFSLFLPSPFKLTNIKETPRAHPQDQTPQEPFVSLETLEYSGILLLIIGTQIIQHYITSHSTQPQPQPQPQMQHTAHSIAVCKIANG